MDSTNHKLFSKTKYMMKHHQVRQNIRPTNIFMDCQNQDSSSLGNLTMYSIVGDNTFKQKFYKERTMETWQQTTQTISKASPVNKTAVIDRKILFSKLDETQKLQCTNQRRIMEKFKTIKERDRRINQHLIKKSGKSPSDPNKTITYGAIQQIYSHPNPQKLDLINSNVPEYWKNSLRDNEKRLKRHLKGNTFKREIAEEMLQTMRGRSLLQKSIPKIKQEFEDPVCSKKAKLKGFRKKGFSLSGNKMTVNIEELGKMQSQSNILPQIQQVHKYQYEAKHKWKLHNLNL